MIKFLSSPRNVSARFDIEALRALAITMVMLFHTGFVGMKAGFVGVDVFFVLSGYLIIGALHREYLSTGRILMMDFWGRRLRRLLPAASLVIGAAALVAPMIVGKLDLIEVRLDLAFAAGFLANLRFGVTASNYWSSDYVSPVLHFWSLGVEEQFYLFAPLYILIVHVLFLRLPMRYMTKAMPIALFVTGGASLAYCFYLAAASPIWAYYSPLSRAWEFAVGGLFGFLGRSARLQRNLVKWPLVFVLWLGIIVSGVLIDPAAGYPSGWALAPAVATGLLLWLGVDSTKVVTPSTNRLFTGLKKLVVWFGGISYSLYLWHWPVLWLIANRLDVGQPRSLPLNWALGGIAASFILADLTKRIVEDPIRFSPKLLASPWRSVKTPAKLAGFAVGVVGLTALLPNTALPASAGQIRAQEVKAAVNPMWLMTDANWLHRIIMEEVPKADFNATLAEAVPDISEIRQDIPEINYNRCHADRQTPEPTVRCTYGRPNSPHTIVLFGDSHAAQYFAGLNNAATARGYRLLPRTRASCPAANVSTYVADTRSRYTECDIWRDSVIRELRKSKPELVIISNQRPLYLYDRQTGDLITDQTKVAAMWVEGFTDTITRLTERGIRVMVIRDVPRWPFDVPDCLASQPAKSCVVAREVGLNPASDDLNIGNRIPLATGIDLTDAICGRKLCFPIRNGIIVVRDDAHLSRTYSLSLALLWQALIVHELENGLQ